VADHASKARAKLPGTRGNRRKEIVDFRPHLPLVFQL